MSNFAELLDVWGAAMWCASWQAGLAALAAWSLCRLWPSLPARFQAWLWRLVVLKFAVALLWLAPVELPLLPATEPTAVAPVEFALATQSSTEPVLAVSSLSQPPASLPLLWIPFTAWAAVVVWQMAQMFVAWQGALRLRNRCRRSEDRILLEQLARLSKSVGLSRPPALLEMAGQGSPLLVGIHRPAIVLPEMTLKRLDVSERALVIGHELAHVRRGDLFWSLVSAAVQAVFFFHPLAWLSERQTRLTQEIAADELAIALQKQDPVRYATLLVSIVSKLGPLRVHLIPTMSVGMAGSQDSLNRRFSAMRFLKPLSRRTVMAYGIVMGLVAVPAIVPWAVVAAEDQPRVAEQPKPADKPRAADQAEPKDGASVHGKFVSFQRGVLKVSVKDGPSDVWQEREWKVAENTKVVSYIRGAATNGVAGEAFKIWEPGASIAVKSRDGKVTLVEIGVKPAADRVPDRAPEKVATKVQQTDKYEWGKFVSFQDGTLTLKANSGALLANRIPENAKALVWDDNKRDYQPAAAAEALQRADVGSWTVVHIAKENVTVRIGARKDRGQGTFVSFKDDRLLILAKNLPESALKKYGNTLHFNKLPEHVQVYESVDGGEYQLIGTANKVLGRVKEGTLVTFHSEGDDNITMIQLGLPKDK